MNAFVSTVRAELYRSLRKKRTYVLAGLLWVILPAIVLLVARVLQTNLGGSFVDENQLVGTLVQEIASPFGLARINLMAPAFLNPTFYIIAIALFAGLLVGEEKSHNMWKTVLAAQPNRLAVIFGKLAVAMLLLGGLMLGGFVFGALFGTVGMLFLDTHFSGQWAQLLGLYGLQWLYALSATIFAFLLIFLVRNVSLGMVMVFFLPALIEGIYTIVRALLGVRPVNRINAFFQALELRVTFENLPRYFFTNNLYAPSRQPVSQLTNLIDEGPPTEGPFAMILGGEITLVHAGTVMLVYGLIFLGLLLWLFLRRDVD